jgi:serine protease inhibitor
MIVLVNAVYFKGLFATPFNESRTHEDTFRSSTGKETKVKMMQEHKKFHYKDTERYAIYSILSITCVSVIKQYSWNIKQISHNLNLIL